MPKLLPTSLTVIFFKIVIFLVNKITDKRVTVKETLTVRLLYYNCLVFLNAIVRKPRVMMSPFSFKRCFSTLSLGNKA